MSLARRKSKVHAALFEPKTIGGVEHSLAVMNGTLAVVFVIGLEFAAYIPVAVLAHALLAYVTKRDPRIRQIYRRYIRQGDRYDPWPHSKQRYNARPKGFGRGMLC